MELLTRPVYWPDPPVIPGTDALRVAAARCAIRAASEAHGINHAVADDAVTSLLTDLHHFCAARRIDFEHALDLAGHYFELDIRDSQLVRNTPAPEVRS